jgi:hypothetical protein
MYYCGISNLVSNKCARSNLPLHVDCINDNSIYSHSLLLYIVTDFSFVKCFMALVPKQLYVLQQGAVN